MWKTTYEIYSILFGVSAVLVLVWGILLNLIWGIRFQLYEPIITIAILEIMMGFSVMPYYFLRLKDLYNK